MLKKICSVALAALLLQAAAAPALAKSAAEKEAKRVETVRAKLEKLGELGELRLGYDVSLPDHEVLFDLSPSPLTPRNCAPPGPRCDTRTGGLSREGTRRSTDGESKEAQRPGPWEPPRPEDWALLGQLHGLVDGVLYWS